MRHRCRLAGNTFGDAYVVQSFDPDALFYWDGDSWDNQGPFQGPAGAQGVQGPAGTDGEDGADGADGAPGEDGASAYDIAVDHGFIGNEAAWLASLEGDAGAQGPEGPAGADGTSVEFKGTVADAAASGCAAWSSQRW